MLVTTRGQRRILVGTLFKLYTQRALRQPTVRLVNGLVQVQRLAHSVGLVRTLVRAQRLAHSVGLGRTRMKWVKRSAQSVKLVNTNLVRALLRAQSVGLVRTLVRAQRSAHRVGLAPRRKTPMDM